MLAVFLSGCQTQAARDACLPPIGIDNGAPSFIAAPYLLYIAGCGTIKAVNSTMTENGWHFDGLDGKVINDQYQSADASFSVSLPGPLAGIGYGGYRINERYLPHDDYVFFASNKASSPLYAIKVTPQLDREYAALSLAEYADLSMQDARLQMQRQAGVGLNQINQQTLQLDGKPTLFRVYRQTLAQTSASRGPSAIYYLIYFMKLNGRAAMISVAWPHACPQCEKGDEQTIRAMDPGLKQFIGSFDMGSSS